MAREYLRSQESRGNLPTVGRSPETDVLMAKICSNMAAQYFASGDMDAGQSFLAASKYTLAHQELPPDLVATIQRTQPPQSIKTNTIANGMGGVAVSGVGNHVVVDGVNHKSTTALPDMNDPNVNHSIMAGTISMYLDQMLDAMRRGDTQAIEKARLAVDSLMKNMVPQAEVHR